MEIPEEVVERVAAILEPTVWHKGPYFDHPKSVLRRDLSKAKALKVLSEAGVGKMVEALKESLKLFELVTALDDHGSNALGQAENIIRTALSSFTGGAKK
jgi:hypothetical protein